MTSPPPGEAACLKCCRAVVSLRAECPALSMFCVYVAVLCSATHIFKNSFTTGTFQHADNTCAAAGFRWILMACFVLFLPACGCVKLEKDQERR